MFLPPWQMACAHAARKQNFLSLAKERELIAERRVDLVVHQIILQRLSALLTERTDEIPFLSCPQVRALQ